ncbi:MAG: DUF192 domain-containing protein [Bacteroidota bacterium]
MAKKKKKTTHKSAPKRPTGKSVPKRKKKVTVNWMAVGIIALLLLFGLAYMVNMVGSANKMNQSGRRIAEMPEPQFRKDGSLQFLAVDSTALTTIDIEIVESPRYIAQGLMYRKSMGANQGMVFKMPTEEPQSFWMKNTYIPLDIIFVNAQFEIVSIQANTTPLSEASLPSGKPAQYVVEVNAGFCAQHQIQPGVRIQF